MRYTDQESADTDDSADDTAEGIVCPACLEIDRMEKMGDLGGDIFDCRIVKVRQLWSPLGSQERALVEDYCSQTGFELDLDGFIGWSIDFDRGKALLLAGGEPEPIEVDTPAGPHFWCPDYDYLSGLAAPAEDADHARHVGRLIEDLYRLTEADPYPWKGCEVGYRSDVRSRMRGFDRAAAERRADDIERALLLGNARLLRRRLQDCRRPFNR